MYNVNIFACERVYLLQTVMTPSSAEMKLLVVVVMCLPLADHLVAGE